MRLPAFLPAKERVKNETFPKPSFPLAEERVVERS
jgi:hypothetical protein